MTILAAVASLVARFRRSRGQERQQLKWLVYAAALLFLSAPVQPLLSELEVAGVAISDMVFGVADRADPDRGRRSRSCATGSTTSTS